MNLIVTQTAGEYSVWHKTEYGEWVIEFNTREDALDFVINYIRKYEVCG